MLAHFPDHVGRFSLERAIGNTFYILNTCKYIFWYLFKYLRYVLMDDNVSVASTRVIPRTTEGIGDRFHRVRRCDEGIRGIRDGLRWRWREPEIAGRVFKPRLRKRRSDVLVPSSTSALKRVLIGIAVRVLLPQLERCVTGAKAIASPIERCEGSLVAGDLVRVLIAVVSHVFE